jgi:hypothetical protein
VIDLDQRGGHRAQAHRGPYGTALKVPRAMPAALIDIAEDGKSTEKYQDMEVS